ncbi:MAG: aminotransferase class V-fold PLP-dependent enzyme, partial [Firmicutes bacterium]|nr:aminotransferase class V-fold PLP-dependent enzyme [Bacillota bacterium]
MIYFDNAATTLRKPECVMQAVMEAMCTMGNSGRGAHSNALHTSRTVYEARAALAELFHAESPERIAFTANSTQSLNMAIKGTLKSGDHVITTALEHNSVLRPLYEMEKAGVQLTILAADQKGNISCEALEAAIRSNTKAIITTHGSNLTGNLLDASRIGGIARNHGLLYILDASQ